MTEEGPRGWRSRVARIALAIATTLVSVNLWTGGPLFAVWVGSRVQAAAGELSMAAVGVTVAVLVAESVVLYRLLAWLNNRYNEVIGRTMRRPQAPWMKPMSGERRTLTVTQPPTTVEKIVAGSVVVVIIAAEIWFFFFAHYRLLG